MVDWGGTARAQGGAPGVAGVPKVEVVDLSKEKVEELFWDTITQVRADLAGSPQEIASAVLCGSWKEMGMAARLCRPGAS